MNYFFFKEQSQITSPFKQYLNLLIIADQEADVKNMVSIITEAHLFFNYEVISSQITDLGAIINKYDAIIFNYSESINLNKSPLETLKWLFNFTQYIPIILITNSLGDELALQCLTSGISGYLLRDKLNQLPQTIYQSIQIFAQQKKIQQQLIINHLRVKSKDFFLLSDFCQVPISIIEENLRDTKCLIHLIDDNNKIQTSYSSQKNHQQENSLTNWQQILNFYYKSLVKGDLIVLKKFDHNLPEFIKKILPNNDFNNLFLVPLLGDKICLGCLTIQYADKYNQWSENDLNLIEIITQEFSYYLYQNYLKEKMTQQIATLEKETENAKLNQADKLELFSNLTHELRTPLTGILGFAKMLNEQIYGQLNSKQIQYVQGIIQSGQHLLELLNDLLDLSKIDATKEELFIEKIAVEDICLASFAIVEQIAVEKQLELKLEIAPEISFCECDQRRLKQILINLLSNAIKFTETGTITLKVTAEIPQIAFSVIDTGIGIKKEDQTKLFQPFVQLQTPLHKQYKGTGLGLVLSRKLAQLHGGDITLSSELGKGSCFTLYLPL